jgi:hypothetical protein
MKLKKDPFSTNMNMVELEGKKVLVRPSQAEMTKGKEVVIGEELQPRMIKPKVRRTANGRGTRGQAATSPKRHLRHPPDQVQGRQGRRQGVRKLDHSKSQTR